ncbi:MAG TPA: rhodanese-like domain-containing protein, partial [Solirubrobacterales bacterium]|nr:rhodanese-like domain-containing protein [Solirubrobacterales bacterium]
MASAEPIELVRSRIEEIDPADAREQLAGGDAVLVDTREQNEWDEAHLEGATLVPPATVADRIEEVAPDRSQRVVLYCRVGNRSARAA